MRPTELHLPGTLTIRFVNENQDATTEDGRLWKFKKLCRDVGVNVLANLIAFPLIYLIGAAAGIFRRVPAALVVAGSILALALMLTAFTTIFLAVRESKAPQKIYKALLGASASALAPGILFVTLGVTAIGRAPIGATISIVFGIAFSVVAAGLLSSAIKHRREPELNKSQSSVE